jgi:pyruvate,water dikinase
MSERIFEAPGPGSWDLDRTHFSKPLTAYVSSLFPGSLKRGIKEGTARYGLFLDYLDFRIVHGFVYGKPVLAFIPEDAPPGPPPDGFFEQPELVARFDRGLVAIENKLWHEDMRRWDEEIKPDSIQRFQQLQAVDTGVLSTAELIQHLIDCRDNLAEMVYRHHVFTVPSILPVGLYLGKVCEWSGVSAGEALELLRGSSPVSLGIAVGELAEVGRLLAAEGVGPERFSAQSPADTLQTLRDWPDPVGSAVTRYLDIVGLQLVSGYDISDPCVLETPEILVGNIWRSLGGGDAEPAQDDLEAQRETIRCKVPAEHRTEFDSLLEEARFINRLRDERGVYNDALALGLSRRAVLEAGRRLQVEGRLLRVELLVHATHEEMLALLRGEDGPADTDLLEREQWYESATTEDAPPFLGSPPEPPPPLEALPENARLAQFALGSALGNLFDHPSGDEPAKDRVEGQSVSTGVYEGIARVIRKPADFHRLQQGDVLVTRNTSPSFNVMMPMVSAIVTDRGGQLSHAAIVAREYGVPAVVGTRNATEVIADGSKVRVDGEAGTVEVIS